MTASDPSEFPDPPRAEGMGRCLAFGLPLGLAMWFVAAGLWVMFR